MNELIKIASNGQWTLLEKADPQYGRHQQLIEQFLAQKKAKEAAAAQKQAQVSRPLEPKANPLEGLAPDGRQSGPNEGTSSPEAWESHCHRGRCRSGCQEAEGDCCK
jgi:hypothetical protein